jgi:hypothetical protein
VHQIRRYYHGVQYLRELVSDCKKRLFGILVVRDNEVVRDSDNIKLCYNPTQIWEFILPVLEEYAEDNTDEYCQTVYGLLNFCLSKGNDCEGLFGSMFKIYAKISADTFKDITHI